MINLYDIDSHLISVNGANNIRDLGNYPTLKNKMTKPFVFLRSDSTAFLSTDSVTTLKDIGVTTVIDLRSTTEASQNPSVFSREPSIHYEQVTMLDEMHSNGFQGHLPASITELYESLLEDSHKQFATIFTRFAHTNGTCLYHCTAGKDRTGLVSMLLLDLAEVPQEIIIADYAATEKYLKEVHERQKARMKAKGIDLPDFVLSSWPETMKTTLDLLYKQYGGSRTYLQDSGVAAAELDHIIHRFVV